jgi:hypothetical protein
LAASIKTEQIVTLTTPTLKRLVGFIGWAFSPVLLGGCQLAEMAQFSYANTTATHRWVDDARSTTLHFELIDDHIVLPVSVNESEPLNFVLDSGAGATVILESRHTNTLALEKSAKCKNSRADRIFGRYICFVF